MYALFDSLPLLGNTDPLVDILMMTTTPCSGAFAIALFLSVPATLRANTVSKLARTPLDLKS